MATTQAAADVLPRAVLPFIPRPLKFLALAVLLVNYRSWPGYWHYRVFRPLITLRLRALLFFTYVRICMLLVRAARAMRLPGISTQPTPPILSLGLPGAREQFTSSLAQRALASPSPLDPSVKTIWSGRAGLDDCDWNMHLSNSAYAKNFDYARVDFHAAYLAPFMADGGFAALGNTQFHFLQEVPIGKPYQIEVFIGGWDEKWLYLVGRFVSRKTAAERRKEKGKAKMSSSSATPTIAPSPRAVPFKSGQFAPVSVSASTPKSDPLAEVKDLSASFTTAADDSDSVAAPTELALALEEAAAAVDSIAADRAHETTVHAVGIAAYTFKHKASRRSIPPALALVAAGFAPGEWARMQRIRYGGARGDVKKFWEGAWADGERWWDDAASSWEEARVRGLAEVARR